MKNAIKLSLVKMLLLVIVGLALHSLGAQGATLAAAPDDLILGFRATSGQGAAFNLEVDLGSVATFYQAAPGSTIPLPGLVIQDLVDTYGASWYSRSGLYFGAAAAYNNSGADPQGKPAATVWVSRANGQPAWSRASFNSLSGPSTTIISLYTGNDGSLDVAPSTTNSGSAAVIDTSLPGSWTKQDLKGAGTSFGYFNPTVDSVVSNLATSSQVVLQLYELQPGSGAGTLLGNLILTRTGLSFHAAGGSVAPVIGVSGNLAFGAVTTGATASATLTITNSGNATLTVTNITYPSGFSGPFSGAIAAGSASNVTVTFAPVAVTTYSGTVTVNSDATSGTNTISASGTGGAAVVTPTKIIGLSGNLAFGAVTTGTTANATLTIANTGNAPLTVTQIIYPSGFSGPFSGPIAAGSATNVTVIFIPVTVTNYSGTVTVNSDATSGTGTIQASGAGVAAGTPSTKIIGVSGNLAFGSVTTGLTAAATLTITNSGDASLTISGISFPAGFSGDFSGPIPAGAAQGVTVTFAPVALSNYTGTVTVNSDATSGTNTLIASGIGSPALPLAIIELDGNLAFGTVLTGTTATATLTITNTGNAALTVSNIDYPGNFSGAFTGLIAAGVGTNVLVTFAPVALSNYTGIVTVTSDAVSGTNTIAVSGTGGTATRVLGLSGNLAFGSVSTGSTATATLTITNAGNSTLTVSNIVYPSGFSGAFSGTIATGSVANVVVTFAPVTLGNYGGSITVQSDATGGTNTMAVSGAGIPVVPSRIIGLIGDLVLGNVTTGTTVTATLTITNAGNSTLTVTNIHYPLGFTGPFSGQIAAGHSQRIFVTFKPLGLFTYTGTVTVNSDATGGINTMYAYAVGSVATTRIIGLTGNLAFGSVITGRTATATMTITNAGKSILTVTGITYPAGFSGPFGGTIAPNSSQGLVVTFAPLTPGSYTGTVTVASDATSGFGTIAASGTGLPIPTRIVGSSGNLAFGTVTTGLTATATLTITNAGNTTLTVNSITYPSGFSGAFSGPIAAGSAVNVPVTFAPIALVNYSGPVTINSDATSIASAIGVSGAGGLPVRIIGLSGNLAFGSVPTGTTATVTLTITNAGNSTLTINNITYPVGFSGAFSGTIAVGTAQGLPVTFAPTALTNYSGTVTVNSDATSGFNGMAVSGTGTPVVPTRIIGLSGNLAFGSVPTGTTAMATLTITNAGDATLTINSISYPTGFSGTFSGSIPAHSAQDVTVTFAPIALGNASGTVFINSDATSGASTLSASGMGSLATRIIGLTGNLAFGAVPSGSNATATLIITNAGNATLTVSSIGCPAGFSGAFSGSIPAGGAQSVTVTFTPVTFSSYSGTVTITSDATSGISTIAASGTGAATRIISLSGNLAFGTVSTSTNATATLQISNVGNATLSVSSITYPAGFSGAFNGAIPAGGVTNLTVTFAPRAAISYNWILTVNSDATSGTSTLVVSGTGFVPPVNHPPVITAGPSITNALAVVNGKFVVVAGETNDFLVGASDPDGNSLTYQWNFGDGVTNATSSFAGVTHVYPVAECGAVNANVAVSDGQLTVTSNLTVIAACQLTITKLQIGLNFAKAAADSIGVTARLDLPGWTAGSQLAGTAAVVMVGPVQVPFILDKKGRGVSTNGTCVLAYVKATKSQPAFWTATITLSKGSWRGLFAAAGLTNTTLAKPGRVVVMPVLLVIGNEAAAADRQVTYTAIVNKTGTAK